MKNTRRKLKSYSRGFLQLMEWMSVKLHISAVTLGLFSKELLRLEWRAGWVLSPGHLHYGRALRRPVRCKLSRRLLLVLETGCSAFCLTQEEVPEKPFIHEYLLLCISRFIIPQCVFSVNISALSLALFVLFNKKINTVIILFYSK